MIKYLMRSMLFIPAHNEKFLSKAESSEADALIFDLEDSVPELLKDTARENLVRLLEDEKWKEKQIYVRVNSLSSGHNMKDLEIFRNKYIDGVVVSKINTVKDILVYDERLSCIEEQIGDQDGRIKLLPLIETAEGVINVADIARSSKRIIALIFGGEDYLDSIWGEHMYPPKAFDVPRAMIAMAARMNHLLPIDTPYLDFSDYEGFMQEEKQAYSMGYAGMLLVNPKQIPWAHECFTPGEKEVEYAKRILEAVEESRRNGNSITKLGDKMIGPPMRKKAEKVLEIYEAVKKKESALEGK